MRIPTSNEILPLHLHTVWSVLDGASSVEDYVAFAASRGMGVCSCTDHGYVMGAYNLIKACRKAGLTPIPGLEAYLMPCDGEKFRYYHLTLWAMNNEGWDSLRTLSNRSWGEGRVVKTFGASKPRVTWQDVAECSAGVLCGTGCILGPVGRPLMEGSPAQSFRNLNRLVEIFGRERLYAEIMPGRVTHEYCRGRMIQVDTTDGLTLSFLPGDNLVIGSTGETVTAEVAAEMRISSISSRHPVRASEVGESVWTEEYELS